MLPNKFICRTYECCTYEKHVNAPLIRKSFEIKDEFNKAILNISGLGFYDLYVNGEKITKGLLAPYISNPDDIVYYDTYDVTNILKTGKNVVGIILGNGMQNCPGGEVWDFEKAVFRASPRVAMNIELDEKSVLEADTSFKTADSPIYFDDLRSGEFYDARLEVDNWLDADFDDSGWDNALICESPRGEKRVCETDPILPRREIKPIEIRPCSLEDYICGRDYMVKDTQEKLETKDGYLYDFGVNTAGIPCLKIKGKKGQKIGLQFCEYLFKGEIPSYKNIDFYPDAYVQRDIYICKGEDEEVFVPRFTYHGARYCVVTGLEEGQATEDLLTFIEYSSHLPEAGNFECSDETVNKLQEMARRSDLANFFYFPTDCPHREKNGWTGDAAASCEHIMMNLHAENSYKEWLRNITKSQLADGRIPGIIPTGGWGFDWGNGPAWDLAMTIIPHTVYRYTDDISILEESADSIFRYVTRIANIRNRKGLIAVGLGDWLQPNRTSGAPTAPQELTDTVICIHICEMAAQIFDVLNMEHQWSFAMDLRDDLRQALRDDYIDFGTMTVKSRCQTAQAMFIYYNIFEKSEISKASDVLVDLIHRNNDFIDTGLLGIRVIFRVLSECGQSELAYKMITRPEYPSYGNMVKQGLTALPEEFFPDYFIMEQSTIDNGECRPASLNHHFFGDISAWFISYICGIRVNEKFISSNYVDIKPRFIKSLDYAKAYHELPCGKVEVEWHRLSDGNIELNITVPDEVVGEIVLEGNDLFQHEHKDPTNRSLMPLKSGKYIIKQ